MTDPKREYCYVVTAKTLSQKERQEPAVETFRPAESNKMMRFLMTAQEPKIHLFNFDATHPAQLQARDCMSKSPPDNTISQSAEIGKAYCPAASRELNQALRKFTRMLGKARQQCKKGWFFDETPVKLDADPLTCMADLIRKIESPEIVDADSASDDLSGWKKNEP